MRVCVCVCGARNKHSKSCTHLVEQHGQERVGPWGLGLVQVEQDIEAKYALRQLDGSLLYQQAAHALCQRTSRLLRGRKDARARTHTPRAHTHGERDRDSDRDSESDRDRDDGRAHTRAHRARLATLAARARGRLRPRPPRIRPRKRRLARTRWWRRGENGRTWGMSAGNLRPPPPWLSCHPTAASAAHPGQRWTLLTRGLAKGHFARRKKSPAGSSCHGKSQRRLWLRGAVRVPPHVRCMVLQYPHRTLRLPRPRLTWTP